MPRSSTAPLSEFPRVQVALAEEQAEDEEDGELPPEMPEIAALAKEWQGLLKTIRISSRRPLLSDSEKDKLQDAQKRRDEIDEKLRRLRQPRETRPKELPPVQAAG